MSFEEFEVAVLELISPPWLVMSISEDGQIGQYSNTPTYILTHV
jgi:hypothetical protein